MCHPRQPIRPRPNQVATRVACLPKTWAAWTLCLIAAWAGLEPARAWAKDVSAAQDLPHSAQVASPGTGHQAATQPDALPGSLPEDPSRAHASEEWIRVGPLRIPADGQGVPAGPAQPAAGLSEVLCVSSGAWQLRFTRLGAQWQRLDQPGAWQDLLVVHACDRCRGVPDMRVRADGSESPEWIVRSAGSARAGAFLANPGKRPELTRGSASCQTRAQPPAPGTPSAEPVREGQPKPPPGTRDPA
jgi:hypothetical protein